ncbi:MAG: arginyltransferase [Pseudomonadota bacterium]|nr:arginyltransferase [Pseudomonadota bacterium]
MKDIQYYITPPHRCSYLEDRSARMVFIDPQQYVDRGALSELSRQGFRRSGDFIYRPECHHCRQCLSARIPAELFKPNSSQKRALKNNRDLRMEIRPTRQATQVHYRLYERYINQRHADGDMFPPSREQFDKFLVDSCASSFFIEFWLADRLMCAATCDELDDGISAVYTFYDPDEASRSLGTFAILKQIEWVQRQQKPFVYLGYWVPEATKMRYKMQYSPLDILLEGRWQRLLQPLSNDETQQLIRTLSRPENISDYRRLR